MKKLLILPFILILILNSCSSDDSSSEDKSVLPQTISYMYPNIYLGTNTTITLKYNGNKIISSTESDSKTLFTYNGDLITKQEMFEIDQQGNETKTDEAVYTYENGKLKTKIFRESITTQYPEGQYITKTVYTHSSNESISYINYSVNINTKEETKYNEGILTYKDGTLTKEQSGSATRVYEYDTKNNPLKNVLGFDLLLNEISEIGKNNAVKITSKACTDCSEGVYLSDYIYNDKNYPTRHTSHTNSGSIEYEIEYTY